MSRDPAAARYWFHLVAAIIWLICMLVTPFLDPYRGMAHLGIMLLMEVSLYANFTTEFGNMDGSLAAVRAARAVLREHEDAFHSPPVG